MQMNTFTGPNYQQKQQKPRTKSATFSHAVAKSDVGEFQDGCFVMVETPQPHRNKNFHQRSAERSPAERPKGEIPQGRPIPRDNSANFHPHPTPYASQQDGEINVSNERFTSPSRSPNRRRSPKGGLDATSPHKPRRAQEHPPHTPYAERTEGTETSVGSPPKGTSPAPSRWAGPAFSKAPPPSSLPIPSFPPLSSSPSTSPSTSPPPTHQPIPSQSPPAAIGYQHYFYQASYSFPPHPQYAAPYSYPPAPTLDQLSMDLRRMLHIEQPVHPIYA